MQSQGKDFTNIIADENSFVRLITVLGVTRHVRRNVQPLF